jgi:hypothetical protein
MPFSLGKSHIADATAWAFEESPSIYSATQEDPPAPLAANLWSVKQGGHCNINGDTFYDAPLFAKNAYSSNSFTCSRNQEVEQTMFYFDPWDISAKGQYGRAFTSQSTTMHS